MGMALSVAGAVARSSGNCAPVARAIDFADEKRGSTFGDRAAADETDAGPRARRDRAGRLDRWRCLLLRLRAIDDRDRQLAGEPVVVGRRGAAVAGAVRMVEERSWKASDSVADWGGAGGN